jgi:nicotinamidase-related amidase
MNNTFKYTRLSKDNAACLLVDHQSGLISLVQDFSPGEFKNNVLALADVAKFFELPTILTTSFEDGPNGPIVPELKEVFPDSLLIARPGQINAWDNEDFVKAIEKPAVNSLSSQGWLRMCAWHSPLSRQSKLVTRFSL